jgi:putative OPT family oligopeptide transporter
MKLAAGSGLRLIPDTAATSAWWGNTLAYFGTNLSPALFGVGYIVGLNIGIVMLAGGVIAWNIAIPLYSTFFLASDPVLSVELAGATAEDAAYGIWSAQIRYLGVGAMLIGGVWTLISLRHSLVSGIKSGIHAERGNGGVAIPRTERDLPMKLILLGLVIFVLPLMVLYQAIVGSWAVSVPMTVCRFPPTWPAWWGPRTTRCPA